MSQPNCEPWRVLGDGSFVLSSNAARALVNIGLVVGSERALVIDTGCGPRHATEILTAVRAVTALPLVVANTHAHWDHFFGNAVFRERQPARGRDRVLGTRRGGAGHDRDGGVPAGPRGRAGAGHGYRRGLGNGVGDSQ